MVNVRNSFFHHQPNCKIVINAYLVSYCMHYIFTIAIKLRVLVQTS